MSIIKEFTVKSYGERGFGGHGPLSLLNTLLDADVGVLVSGTRCESYVSRSHVSHVKDKNRCGYHKKLIRTFQKLFVT